LISEQICEEAQRHEAEIVHELEEKISDLRKLLQDKEFAIQELEKIKPIPEQEGVVIKYREVLNATDQNIKLHNEIEALNGMLAKVSKELNKLQAEKQEIMTINFSLTNELAKLKATLSSPLNFPPKFGLGRMNSGGDFGNADNQGVLLFQPPIEYMDENSPLPSPLGGQANEVHHSKAPVPKLDLSKAKHIQEQYAKKITQPQQQNYAATYNVPAMDKLKQLEEELEMTRKRLSHEMINNRLISEEISKVYRQNRQLVGTNEILIKSNKRYEEKWQKIFYTLEFYKEFYHKYIDLITRGGPTGHMKSASLSTPKFETFPRFKGKMFVDPESDPDKMIKELRRANEDNGKQVNVSILEANEEGDSENAITEKAKANNVYEFTKEQSKIYLLNLAKDLYVNSNLQKSSAAKRMLQTLKFSANEPASRPRYKVKRSMSNALEYVSERKKFIFEPKWKQEKETEKIRNDNETFNEQNDGLLQNLDNSEIGPFESENKIENEGRGNAKTKVIKPFAGEENISFTVDADEFNKKQMVEASFISNNDILDSLKHD